MSESETISNLDNQFERTETKLKAILKVLFDSRSLVMKYANEIEFLKQDKNLLENLLEQERREHEIKTGQMEDLLYTMNHLQQQHFEAITKANAAIDSNTENIKLKYDIEVLQSKYHNLERELCRMKADYEKLRAQNQKLQSELSTHSLQKLR